MTRVLIVDDQDIVRQGLGVILGHSEGIEVAGYAADGLEALAQVAALQPEVVLMDLKMPRLNGIQATARIAREHPGVKVVVLTTYDADEWLFDAIRAGASGYLLKDSDSREIVEAVQRAAAGEVRIDPAVAGRVLQEFNRLRGEKAPEQSGRRPSTPFHSAQDASHSAQGASPAARDASHSAQGASPTARDASHSAGDAPLAARDAADTSADALQLNELTERERAILQELAQGKNNREIAASLYLAEGTVKNYVSVIIEKLQANDRTHAAILALKRGLATLE